MVKNNGKYGKRIEQVFHLVQFIYDVVIYKLKRYKSLRDLYLFNP